MSSGSAHQEKPIDAGPAPIPPPAYACPHGNPLPTGLESSPARPLPPPDLGPLGLGAGLDDPRIVTGALTPERERALRSRARSLLMPLLPVDLDLLITDAATAAHWAGSRWHVLGHIHREGRPLHAP